MIRNNLGLLVIGLTLGVAAGCGSDAEGDGAADAGLASDVAMGGEAGTGDLDWQDITCTDASWEAGACAPAMTAQFDECEATHIAETTPITYENDPVACGPHRPQWARWGAYEYLPPQRYLHNLEHGGIAFLYHPCAPQSVIDDLQAIASARQPDDRGPFRYVLSPSEGVQQTIAVLAWGQSLESHCVDADEIGTFIDAHYRTAPEDVSSDGSYERGWLSR